MKIVPLPLPGLQLIELDVFRDARGFFMERFNEKLFQEKIFGEAGISLRFAQDNHSRSVPGVIRGLHYQTDPAQGKLVGVVRGKIWDVSVDLRPKSRTFGRHFGVELDGESGRMLWVPPGFAHGFCVLGTEPADVLYKVDSLYSAASDRGILWSDPSLAIPWPVSSPTVSEKDRHLPSFDQYAQYPVFTT